MPIDQRFFDYQGPQSLRALLAICGLDSDATRDLEITGIASSENAVEGDLCFFEGKASQAESVSPRAAACFVKPSAASGLPEGVLPIASNHPRTSHKQASEALF